MKKRLMFPIFLAIIGVLACSIAIWWLLFTGGDQRIIERFARINNELVTTVEVPIGETPYVHIWTYTGSSVEKAELWDPNGNLVSTQFPQDKRNPLDRFSDYWFGSRLIYRVDFSLWQPIEGEWQVKIFGVPERSGYTFDLYANARSDIALDVELGQPQEVGEGLVVPVVAQLYHGNALICDENLQIEVEVKARHADSPEIRPLQSDDHCVFTGSTGILELGDPDFYVIAKYGFIRRQLIFDNPN